MPRAVAISPHLDDAAFSCGGILARLAQAGWDVTVCTVFTLSVPDPTGFALACQLDKNLPADVDYMALRRQEDALACRHLGCTPVWLPFAEAPHRGYPDPSSLFGPLRPDDQVGAGIADAVGQVLAGGMDLLLGPQAIGGHVDHVQTALALHRLQRQGVPALWWTDFPYSIRPHSHPARPFAAMMECKPEMALAVDATVRLAACAAYTTQIGFQFGGQDGLKQALGRSDSLERIRIDGMLPVALSGIVAAGT